MKIPLLLLAYLIKVCSTTGQTVPDSSLVYNPDAKYGTYIYSPETNTKNFSYNYSNIWDLDGDKKLDSIYFIGNGGVHTYFFLRVILSSTNKTLDFLSAKVDMPYLTVIDASKKIEKNLAIQFVVGDLNNDSISDIYLNFDNHFGEISKRWRTKGIKTKYVVLSFSKGNFQIKDY